MSDLMGKLRGMFQGTEEDKLIDEILSLEKKIARVEKKLEKIDDNEEAYNKSLELLHSARDVPAYQEEDDDLEDAEDTFGISAAALKSVRRSMTLQHKIHKLNKRFGYENGPSEDRQQCQGELQELKEELEKLMLKLDEYPGAKAKLDQRRPLRFR